MEEKIIYKGPIREGAPGCLSSKTFEVVYDNHSKYAKLKPIPTINYKSDAYRKLVNDSSIVEDYFRAHDAQQPGYFKFIAPYLKRGHLIADCGCGAGSMLDLVKGYAKMTLAIEPFVGYHKSLIERGHFTFNSIKAALKSYSNKVDLALSIHVIEHTKNPLEYIKDIYNLLTDSGTAVVFTPNLDDILLKLHPEVYAQFFFRIVHNYYFTGKSLEIIGKKVGFRKAKIFYYHEFGLGNMICWLRENKAKNNVHFDCISNQFDLKWIQYLEYSGQSYNVGVILEK